MADGHPFSCRVVFLWKEKFGGAVGADEEMGRYLSSIDRLKEHRYAFIDDSISSKLLMPYWNTVVLLFPSWVAPNVITFLGLLCVVAAFLLVAVPDPSFSGFCPDERVYFVAAVLFWCYQTLDAVDGKQARRTNSSSALGELWDHGVDSIAIGLLVLVTAHGLLLPVADTIWLLASIGVVLFYMAHAEEYHVGYMRFPQVSVSDGLMAVELVLIVTSLCGRKALWLYPVFGGLATLNVFLCRLVSVPVVVFLFAGNLKAIRRAVDSGKTPMMHGYRCPSHTVQEAMTVSLRCLFIAVPAMAMPLVPRFERVPLLVFYLTILAIGSHISIRITVCRMVRAEMGHTDPIIYLPLLLLLNEWIPVLDLLVGLLTGHNADVRTVWGFACLLSIIQHIDYLVDAVGEFKRVLHVKFWTISRQRPPE